MKGRGILEALERFAVSLSCVAALVFSGVIFGLSFAVTVDRYLDYKTRRMELNEEAARSVPAVEFVEAAARLPLTDEEREDVRAESSDVPASVRPDGAKTVIIPKFRPRVPNVLGDAL